MAFGQGWSNGFGQQVDNIALVDLPCVRVEVAAADSPFTPTPTWSPVDGVMFVEFEHSQSGQLDEYGPGTLTAIVDNTSGDWTPDDAQVMAPNQQIRVVAEHSTGDVIQFRGFVDDDPTVEYDRFKALVAVRATNLVRILSGVNLPPDTYPEETVTGRFERVLDAASVPVQWRQINGTTHMCPAETVDGSTTVWAYMVALARAEGGAVFVSKSGHVVFQERLSLLSDIYRRVVVATFSDNDAVAAGSRFARPTWGRHSRRIRNRGVYSELGGEPTSYEAAASAAAYGPRDLDRMTDLKVRSRSVAKNRVEWNIAQWGDPHSFGTSLALNVIRTADTVTDQAITRGLRDRVRFVHTTPSGTVHDDEVFVERIRTVIEPAADRPWVTELGFSPAARFEFSDVDNWVTLDGSATLGDGKMVAP